MAKANKEMVEGYMDGLDLTNPELPTQDLEQAMAGAKAEAELVSLRLQLQQLRNFLAGALCTVCGDPLGEEEIIQDDDDQTMHAKCERDGDGAVKR